MMRAIPNTHASTLDGLAYAGLDFDGLAYSGLGYEGVGYLGAEDSIAVIGPTSGSTAIQRVQTALKAKGYYPLPPTGQWDSKLEQAIMNFQAGKGLSASGYADAQTQAHLGLLDAKTTRQVLDQPSPFATAIKSLSQGFVTGLSTTGGAGVPGVQQYMTDQQTAREQAERNAVSARNQAMLAIGGALVLVAVGTFLYKRSA